MAMAISLSDQPQPKPSPQTQPPKNTAPIQATDDLPMYRDIPSAPTYDPLPEPEYTNPQVTVKSLTPSLPLHIYIIILNGWHV